MKIRHLDKLFEQMQHDVKKANENVERLAIDQARTEQQLEELWKHCFFLQKEFDIRNNDFAENSQLQKVICEVCFELTDKWKVRLTGHNTPKVIQCVSCYIAEEDK